MTKLLSTLLTVGLLLGCGEKSGRAQDPIPTPENAAQEKFGQDYRIWPNKTGSHALVTKEVRIRPNQLHPTIAFFVYDAKHGEMMHEDRIPRGEVKWINDEEIKVRSIREVGQQKGSGAGYTYNVKTGVKNATTQ